MFINPHLLANGLFFVYFRTFSNKQYVQILQQINAKNVHPVFGAWIRTHSLLIKTTRPGQGVSKKVWLQVRLVLIVNGVETFLPKLSIMCAHDV